ncbi:unnamed protein product [Caenorhabditis bovis]|uniref:Low-density lipoprotein receptor domain class A n=1 Tax=Caenorhabditis bovis TaxID=2654633 RepID=A0A8S1FF05_9PELO|nr:unnamed protein product [Caenorhabditis bovis]
MRRALFLLIIRIIEIHSQYQNEPQSNIDRVAQRPILPQCPREWEWACRNGECIAHYDVCDGIVQCTDGSDEWNCDTRNRGASYAHEGNPGKVDAAPTTMVPTTTTQLAALSSTFSTKHTFIGIVVLAIVAFALVTAYRRRARKKTGFRNRRGAHSILQQDSDEDDILISSMYS